MIQQPMASEPSPPSSPDLGIGAKSGADKSEVRVQRQALVPYVPARMFALVADFERYPVWFDWCATARVLERENGRVRAELGVRVAGISVSFSTENVESPPESIELRLLQGPFRQLNGRWTFQPIGEFGTRVGLDLAFEVNSSLVAGALSLGFRRLADRMVDDFCRAARAEYGRD
jgi:ribosome-associated toxin RatA of RatAB toxin-antitoxin module